MPVEPKSESRAIHYEYVDNLTSRLQFLIHFVWTCNINNNELCPINMSEINKLGVLCFAIGYCCVTTKSVQPNLSLGMT